MRNDRLNRLDRIVKIVEIVSAIATIFFGIFTIKSYFVTRQINNIQLKIMENQLKEMSTKELPNLKIVSVESHKHQENSTIYDGTYCFLYKATSNQNLEGLPSFKIRDLVNETAFFNEIESRIDEKSCQPTVYLTYFGSKPFLVLNCATDKNNYDIAHSNVKITFYNYGAVVSAISVKSLVIYYNNALSQVNPFFVKGDDNSKIILSPQDNKEFTLFFDEVTTNKNSALCQIDKNVYEAMPDSVDLIRFHMIKNYLNYSKLELILNCWDVYDNKTELKITLEYNGNFFVSSTTLVQ